MPMLVTITVPKDHRLGMFSDTHWGSRGHSENAWDKFVARTRAVPKMRNFHLGDVTEAIFIDDKRFLVDEHSGRLQTAIRQYEHAKAQLKRVKNLELILQGNHDRKRQNVTGDMVRDFLCGGTNPLLRSDGNPVRYGTYDTVLTVKLENSDLSYKVFLWHGAGKPPRSDAKSAHQRIANRRATSRRRLEVQHSDTHVNLMGHWHNLDVWREPPETILWSDEDELHVTRTTETAMNLADFQNMRVIPGDQRWYGITGCFKKSRESYREGDTEAHSSWESMMGFGASDLGWVELVVKNEKLWLEPHFA